MHSSRTLALSCSVLFLNMQNFAPVSGLALDPYISNASLGFPYPAQNSWPPKGLQATAGTYQQQGPYQPQGQSWNAKQANQIQFHQLIQQQNRNHLFNFTNPISAPNYQAQQGWPLTNQTWQQPVGFVAVPDAALASLAIITYPGVSPFALPDAKKAPPAPQQSYASVAKSTKTNFSVSLDAEQANRLVKRSTRWQDSDCMAGVMIAKDGEQLTPKIFQKIVIKL